MLQENEVYYEVSQKLAESAEKSREKQYYYGIWAPIITEYAKWVLTNAINDGVERLYFLARDAYPAYVATKILSDNSEIQKIECRYLRVSRQSVRVPEAYLIGNDALEMLFNSGIDVTFRKICKRAKLTEQEMNIVADSLNISDVDIVLNRKDIKQLRSMVENRSIFMNFVLEHAKEAYASTIDYFWQEGLFDDKKIALVDSGWVGTMQRSIECLINSVMPQREVQGYYFGLYEIPPNVSPNKYRCFYFEPTKNAYKKYRFSNCLFEAIYSENRPMTIGYTHEEMVAPVYSNAGALNIERSKVNEICLVNWLNEYLQECRRSNIDITECPKGGVPDWMHKMLKSVMSEPDIWEAQYYGTYKFSDDVDDGEYKDIAPAMSKRDIDSLRVVPKLLVNLGLSQRKLHESAWIEGSCLRSGGYGLRAMRRSKLLTVARQQVKQICLKR